jgi:hypothetical protein
MGARNVQGSVNPADRTGRMERDLRIGAAELLE